MSFLRFDPAVWFHRLAPAAVIGLFCLPLFIGLRNWDMRNDEAIYSYAVDRVLETNDWLTPRAIPTDEPFLEKPPLKFWLVAGAMRLGVLPWDDFGMRAFDALFCGVAFLYIYRFAQRLAGTLAGVVSVFLMFSFDPLILEHGVRGNNMDAAVFLAYCGGMYHFYRWASEEAPTRRRRHTLAWAAYFVLGFMTKFVAIAFLPIAGVVSLGVRPGGLRRLWGYRQDWVRAAILIVVAIAPWFVYQTVHSGRLFWDTLLFQHVLQRFTGVLEVTHLKPWYHYFTQTWFEMDYADLLPAVLAGVAVLAWRAWWRGEWLARCLFIWWLVPYGLLSAGTSKLFYYAYPFMPPLMIGAGAAAALVVDGLAEGARSIAVRLGAKHLSVEAERTQRTTRWATAFAVLGALAFVVAIYTFARGSLTVEIGGIRLFRNSSVVRAIAAGALCWYFAGMGSVVFRIAALTALVFVLPVSRYDSRVAKFSTIDHPLRTARDCALAVQKSGAAVGTGLFEASGDMHHGYFYYLRRTGPWLYLREAKPDELKRRLEQPGEQTLVSLSVDDYKALGAPYPWKPAPPGGGSAQTVMPLSVPLTRGLPPAIAIGDAVVILFPGPYGICAPQVAEAGSRLLPPSGR